MYKTILITLDGRQTDRAIIEHVKPLAKLAGSQVVLFHVVSSVAAKYHGEKAADKEVGAGEAYLEKIKGEFEELGVSASIELAYGEPAKEIVKRVNSKSCDLVAMSTHGHQFVADLILGTTAFKVQHSISVPVLMLRAK